LPETGTADWPGLKSIDFKDLEANRLTKLRISSREVSISIPVDSAIGFDPTCGWYPIKSALQFNQPFPKFPYRLTVADIDDTLGSRESFDNWREPEVS
jgi:hypothetical protein